MNIKSRNRPTMREPIVWMDITTSLRHRHSNATGTLRVEREAAAALVSRLGDRLRFCRYDRVRKRFVRVVNASFGQETSILKRKMVSGPGVQKKDTIGKRIERSIRVVIRDTIRAIFALAQSINPPSAFPEAMRGDLLFLAGETWSERYDFDSLHRLRSTCGLRIAAICQDLIPINFPQFFESAEFVRRYAEYTQFLLSDVDLLIVPSQAVRLDVEAQARKFESVIGKLLVVKLGSDVGKTAAPTRPHTTPALEPETFVISVSTIQSRKNVDLLYRIWHRFAEEGRSDLPRLVIVGQRGFGSGDLLWQITNDPIVRDSILVMSDVTDTELNWLYRNCRFTLYPSFAEGWGLPVSESLAHGKACLTSNSSSLPEAGAGLAIHLDPLDFKAWHDKIIEWSDHPTVLAELARKIDADYQSTTWTETGNVIAGHIETMMNCN